MLFSRKSTSDKVTANKQDKGVVVGNFGGRTLVPALAA